MMMIIIIIIIRLHDVELGNNYPNPWPERENMEKHNLGTYRIQCKCPVLLVWIQDFWTEHFIIAVNFGVESEIHIRTYQVLRREKILRNITPREQRGFIVHIIWLPTTTLQKMWNVGRLWGGFCDPFGRFGGCFGDMFGRFWQYFGDALGMILWCFGHVLDMFREYV